MTKLNAPVIKELNETLVILERALHQYNVCNDESNKIVECIKRITDKIAGLS